MKTTLLLCFYFFTVSVQALFSQTIDKSLWVEFANYSLIGNSAREDQLIYYAQTRGYNSFIFYGTGETFHHDEIQDVSRLSFEPELKTFMNKARGIPGNETFPGNIHDIGVPIGSTWNNTTLQANAVYPTAYSILLPDDGICHPLVR
jgi:hypothetical protein